MFENHIKMRYSKVFSKTADKLPKIMKLKENATMF